jgi:two-component system sensor histidine kinase and response regulator WspE
MSDLGGFSMMELFREEIRSLVATLSEGLLALEHEPANPRVIEPLMRAAHSIKGAARIVQVEPAVQLAHAMESLFVAIGEGQVAVKASDIDLFLQATDLLGQLSQVRESELPTWCARQEKEVERLKEQFSAIHEGRRVESEIDARVTPAAIAEPEFNEVREIRPATVMASVPIPRERLASEHESSMMSLFRGEVRSAAITISEGWSSWVANPADRSMADSLLDAARAIQGAAKLVRIESIAQLAKRLIECFTRALENPSRGILEKININDPLSMMAELLLVEDNDLPVWMAKAAPRMEAIADGWNELIEPRLESAAPTVMSTTREDEPGADEASTRVVPTVTVVGAPTVGTGETDQAVVRVTAASLNRLLGLAGESLVQARWLDPFSTLLRKLKKQQDGLSEAIESIAVMSNGESRREQIQGLIADVRRQTLQCRETLASRIEEFQQHAARAEDLNSRLYREVIASRMRPFSDGAHAFPRLVRDMARDLKKQVKLVMEGVSTAVDRDVLEKLEAPLTHLLRNAVDHGIEMPAERQAAGKAESGTIHVKVQHRAGMLCITIADDGGGIDPERLRVKIVERRLSTTEIASRMNEAELLEFLFLPGFSTASALTEYSGRGVGLDVVQTMVRQVGGSVRVSSVLGRGTTFHLQLPITLSVLRAVIVHVAGEPYAFPQNRIDRLIRVNRGEIRSIEHRQFISVDGEQVGLVMAAQLFDLPTTGALAESLSILLLSDQTGQYGLIVDSFQGEQDLVVRPLDPRLGKVATLSAAAILDDGSPVLIADVEDLIRSMDQFIQGNSLRRCEEASKRSGPTKRILVVDDSITVREVERQLLRSHGYDVSVAVDGREGLAFLQADRYDLVVSDVDMPRMNGLELVRAIRNDQSLQRLPVIIVSYKEREEDRMRGLEVGANAYLTKSSFHDNTFLRTVVDLIGESGACE